MTPKKISFLFLAIIISSISYSQDSIRFTTQKIQLKSNFSFNLKIPVRYKICIAVSGLNRPRFFAKSPDGRLFVTDMYNRDDNKKGKIYILESLNDTTKKFEKITTYHEGLRNPNQVGFYTINNQSYIFIAETHSSVIISIMRVTINPMAL